MNCIVTEFLFTNFPHFVVAVAFILDFFFHQNRTETPPPLIMMSSTVHPTMRGPSTSRKINDAGGPKSSTHGFSSTTNGSTQFWDVMDHVHVTLDEVNEGIDYLESQLDCNVNDAETASSSAESFFLRHSIILRPVLTTMALVAPTVLFKHVKS